MGFKFQPGDQVYIVDEESMPGWTKCPTGTRGTVLKCQHVNNDICHPVIVQLRVRNKYGRYSWWVFESDIDFVNQPLPVDVSSLL